MKYLISCVILLAVSVTCVAQPYGDSKFKQKFNKADALVYDGAYMEALPLLEEMYASDTMNANLNHLLGICYLMGKKNHSLAILRLEAATRDVAAPGSYEEGNWKEKRAPGITYYYLGKAYHFKNEFDRAVSNYYNYRSYIELDDVETYNQVRQQIQYAENAMELVKNPIAAKITNLGPTINTKFPEYCPIVSADGRILIFNSRREGSTGGAVDDNGQFFDDVYISDRQPSGWSKPKQIEGSINTPGHDAAIGLSPDGQMLFIYKDDNGNGNIYYSTKTSNGWATPEPMRSDINSSSWETHATVTAAQDMLVFVSNRTDGYGGRDLWFCKKLPNGEWALAQNMGSVINSQFEEEAPFITADGSTLIFSSQGHTSMGGFDIFRSEFADGAWTVPENIGYPINTSEDDVFFTLAPDGRTAYYSSARDGGFGESDIYVLKLPAEKSNAMAVARGVMKVPAMAYADIKAEIVVTDDGGAKVGTYRPNPATGFFVLVLSPGETYTITYKADGYEPVVAKLPVADDESYQEYDGVLELEEVVFGENILALQNQTKKLEEEAAKAALLADENQRLAEEAEAKAKLEQEQLALAKKEERKKAENAAAKEKEQAELALAEEQSRADQAELERRKAEAKARFEAIQAQATKDAAEKEKQEQLAAEQQVVPNTTEEVDATELAAQQQAKEQERQAAELAAKKAEEDNRLKAEAEAKAKSEREAAELAARQKAEQEAKEKAAREAAELAAKKAEEESRLQAEAKAKAEREAAELAARQKAEQAAKEKAAREAAELAAKKAEEDKRLQAEADAAAQAKVDAAAQQKALEASNRLAEEEAAKLALVEAKRKEIQQRIAELRKQQEAQELAADKAAEEVEVKEVAITEMETSGHPVSVDAKAIDQKRQAMLARIEELKKQKTEVQKKKVVDEKALVEASDKELEATGKKKELEAKAEKTQDEIAQLQKELEVVEKQVKVAEVEVQKAKTEVAEAKQKLENDIAEEKRIEEEEKKKAEEAAEAARKVQELEAQAKKKLEEEKRAKEKLEQEQRAEAERTRQELMQMEALAEQQRQVQAALEAEERKRIEIEAAEADAFSQKEILANSETLSELRKLNERLINDNLDLKRQLADLNKKLDIILSKLGNDEGIELIDIPPSPMLQNLQEGKRLILRNIYFDYNLATLRSKSKYELNKLFEFLKANPSVRIEVAGHTDSRGNDDYNLRLSRERAQAVVDYLIRNGISSSRLRAVGYGETRPIARNENADLTDNPIGRQLNRRIEIKLLEGELDGVEIEEVEVPKEAQIK